MNSWLHSPGYWAAGRKFWVQISEYRGRHWTHQHPTPEDRVKTERAAVTTLNTDECKRRDAARTWERLKIVMPRNGKRLVSQSTISLWFGELTGASNHTKKLPNLTKNVNRLKSLGVTPHHNCQTYITTNMPPKYKRESLMRTTMMGEVWLVRWRNSCRDFQQARINTTLSNVIAGTQYAQLYGCIFVGMQPVKEGGTIAAMQAESA
jgi:hypothetical protein